MVEGTALEMRRARKGTESSNLSLSALTICYRRVPAMPRFCCDPQSSRVSHLFGIVAESNMAKKKKTPDATVRFFDPKEKTFCVYEVYARPKRTVYYIRGGQDKHFSSITLDGFQGLPAGLYLNKGGYGFGKKGVFLLSALKQHLGGTKPVDLVISSKNTNSITGRVSYSSILL